MLACSILAVITSIPYDQLIITRSARAQDSKRLQILRGGAISSGADSNALTREEITSKLNGIPTFCIISGEGGLIGMRDKDGNAAVRWFINADEARTILTMMIDSNPSVTGLKLGVYGLGRS